MVTALALIFTALAATSARADMLSGTDLSALAATDYEGKPVIAFLAFDGPLRAQEAQIIIATPSTLTPTTAQDWQFHTVREGLCAYPKDGSEIVLRFVKAGTILALCFVAQSEDLPDGIIAAWTKRYPQSSDDWSITPIGIDFSDDYSVAGTDKFLALGITTFDQLEDSSVMAQTILRIGCAKTPLPETAADWFSADIPFVINGVPLQQSKYDGFSNLSLVASGTALYAATTFDTSSSSFLIIAKCTDPLRDLSRWEFTSMQSSIGSSLSLSATGSRLSLTYTTLDQSCAVWYGDCATVDALEPAAWRWSLVDQHFNLVSGTLDLADGVGVVYNRWDKKRQSVFLAYNALDAMAKNLQATWSISAIPVGGNYIYAMCVQGKPAVATFTYGDPGQVSYAWSDKPVPRSKSDWHVSSVHTGQSSGAADSPPEGPDLLRGLDLTSWTGWLTLSICAIALAVVSIAIYRASRKAAR